MSQTITPPTPGAGTTKCPHCKHEFVAAVDDSQPLRLQGAKCPSCKLFVPARHLVRAPLTKDERRARG